MPSLPHRIRTWWAACAAALIAVACGGGGSSDVATNGGGVGVGGTGAQATLAIGSVSGFGSIVVNGVRYDIDQASIVDEDGSPADAGELQLGMQVAVQGGTLSTDAASGLPTGTARTVVYSNPIEGPVEAQGDATTRTLTVLGQTVTVDDDTWYSGYSGLVGSVQKDDLVEICAYLDPATGTYHATRIENRSSQPMSGFKLRGVVRNLSTGNSRFDIGGATISYAALSPQPTLSNGQTVVVKLSPTRSGGNWIATRVTVIAPTAEDGTQVRAEGIVDSYAGVSSFQVNGLPVDAGSASGITQNGSPASLANGQRVEVEGTVRAGVLRAAKVEIKSNDGGSSGDEVVLFGVPTSIGPAAATFVLRGVTVTYDGTTRFDAPLTPATLDTVTALEVRGVRSSDGRSLRATRIRQRN